jgi:GTP-binding protein HflX
VAAFRSTLQETVEADLLLHVVDASDEQMAETIQEVDRVIAEIGADEVPQIRLMNKIDRLENVVPHIERGESGQVVQVWVSAQARLGLDLLTDCLRNRFSGRSIVRDLQLGPMDGQVRASLYRVATILRDEKHEAGGWSMRIEGSPESLRFLEPRFGLTSEASEVVRDVEVHAA